MKIGPISDRNYQSVKKYQPKKLQNSTNNVRLTFSIGDTNIEVYI